MRSFTIINDSAGSHQIHVVTQIGQGRGSGNKAASQGHSNAVTEQKLGAVRCCTRNVAIGRVAWAIGDAHIATMVNQYFAIPLWLRLPRLPILGWVEQGADLITVGWFAHPLGADDEGTVTPLSVVVVAISLAGGGFSGS